MIGKTNAGTGLGKSTLVVQSTPGARVTVTQGQTTRVAAERFGVWAFPGLAPGEWTIRGENAEGLVQTKTVTMDGEGSQTVMLRFNYIPSFTYTGDYKIVNDNDNEILTSLDNWKIRLLTSGKLTFTELRGAEDGIDVFLVGGGAGGGKWVSGATGGGSGYTKTISVLTITPGVQYDIVIGAGNTGAGGMTTAFGESVNGGSPGASGSTAQGGNGGSGGGSYYGDGGSDGSDGVTTTDHPGGLGQGTTTREFGDTSGKLYAGGGAGGNFNKTSASTTPRGGEGGGGNGGGNGVRGTAGAVNTGSGGGSGGYSQTSTTIASGAPGGSGIIIIRNHREEAA